MHIRHTMLCGSLLPCTAIVWRMYTAKAETSPDGRCMPVACVKRRIDQAEARRASGEDGMAHMYTITIMNLEEPKMKKTYGVEVDCAACAEKMQEAIRATKGVKDATLSFMTLKVKVEFEEGADIDAVMQEARKNVKKIEDDMEIIL